jgi:phosphoribosyl 1,2-cyclic phosphate phosphodiesterase
MGDLTAGTVVSRSMELTILGSGGCMVIPKPLCRCRVCEEAREKGPPFARTGPSAFLHDVHLLIDTPAEIACQLNRERISEVKHLLLTHLDPDHVEGLRVVEQITLDFRTWRAYPEKRIRLLLPRELQGRIRNLRSAYGPKIDYYVEQGFVEVVPFDDTIAIRGIRIHALPVDRGDQIVFIYVFNDGSKRMVYAPCDIKPFPEHLPEVRNPDLLVIQPGIFEKGLKHDFTYPADHISRSTLYTFEHTVDLARRLEAAQVVFVHLEEYWNRSHQDYKELEKSLSGMRFAFDGMKVHT